MKLTHKLFTVFLLWLTIGFSVIVFVSNKSIKVLMIFIAVAVTIHLIRLKTFRKED